MKFVFFLTLLVNIVFFLWEYRKGAPAVYLPPAFKYSTSDAQQILLLTEARVLTQQAIGQAATDKKRIEQQVKPVITEAFVEKSELAESIKHEQAVDESHVQIAHNLVGQVNQLQPAIAPQPSIPQEPDIKTETQLVVSDVVQENLENNMALKTAMNTIS